MIFMHTKAGQYILILEPLNLERLREKGVIKTPDAAVSVIIGFTPDIFWTTEQITNALEKGNGSLDVAEIDRILDEGRTRPEVKNRPYHGHIDMLSGRREGGSN